jgi:hypothetical protein
MSGATSLRGAMEFLLGRDAGAWPSDFLGTQPASLSELLAACQDPRLAEWSNLARSRRENRPWTEEANGVATDGQHWFISNNSNDGREALRKLTLGFDVVRKLPSPFDPDVAHVGALSVRDGWVYVAIQHPMGVWRVSTDLAQSAFLQADALPDEDMFPWCDLNPHNGLLYTSAFTTPAWLRAYTVSTNRLIRAPDADIPLVQPTDYRPTTRVQGACFTVHHKVLIVCDDSGYPDLLDPATWWVERIHCHSTITGAFLGRRLLPAETDEGSVALRNELEDIWVVPLTSPHGWPIHVHVLELNNELHSEDDFYLWHFSVPDPEAL